MEDPRRKCKGRAKEKIDESSLYTDCELEFIGEGIEFPLGAEICANEGGRRSDEKEKKESEVEEWEYWLG